MFNIIKRRSTHAGKLERWLGKEHCEQFSALTADWYGPPIPVAGVPGNVSVARGGNFIGDVHAGGFASVGDRVGDLLRAMYRNQKTSMGIGFPNGLDDIRTAYKLGKAFTFSFSKYNVVATYPNGRCLDMFSYVSQYPSQGAAAAAAPGGTVYTASSTGGQTIPTITSGQGAYLINLQASNGLEGQGSIGGCFLLYDRLFGVNKTMNSTASETVTGVPTRYQSTTSTNDDWIGGNFCTPFARQTALANTAHNWTVCSYTNESGAAKNFPSATGVASCNAYTSDSTPGWFMPLDGQDQGVGALTAIQCSALVATGVAQFVIGHPLAWCTAQTGFLEQYDFVMTSFNLARVYDDCCAALLCFQPQNGSNLPLVQTTATVVMN